MLNGIRKLRNKLTALLRTTVINYHEIQLEINKNDSKTCFEITREVIDTKNNVNNDSCVFQIMTLKLMSKRSYVINLTTLLISVLS